jgi:hypothetical protein
MMNNKPPLLFALFTASDEQGGNTGDHGACATDNNAEPRTIAVTNAAKTPLNDMTGGV